MSSSEVVDCVDLSSFEENVLVTSLFSVEDALSLLPVVEDVLYVLPELLVRMSEVVDLTLVETEVTTAVSMVIVADVEEETELLNV